MDVRVAGKPHLICGQTLQDVFQVRVRIKFVELDHCIGLITAAREGPPEEIRRTAGLNASAQSGESGSPPRYCRSMAVRRRCSASV
jgi:hypothetical protein